MGIGPASFKQLVVAPLLNQPPVGEHNNAVGPAE